MNDARGNQARRRDAEIRERINPLLDELSPLGKLELALRLTGEAILAPIHDTPALEGTRRELEAPKDTPPSSGEGA